MHACLSFILPPSSIYGISGSSVCDMSEKRGHSAQNEHTEINLVDLQVNVRRIALAYSSHSCMLAATHLHTHPDPQSVK